MTRLLLIVPCSGFGTDEGTLGVLQRQGAEARLAALVRVVNRAAELAGFEVTVQRDAVERDLGARLLPAPVNGVDAWSGEFRTGDEVNTVRVVDGRIVSVA